MKNDCTLAVPGKFRPDCVNAASSLGGSYSVTEAIDEKVPVTLAAEIDTKGGAEVAQAARAFVAASLAGHCQVILADAVPGLDNRNVQTLVKAVLHTSGQRQFP